MSKGRPPADQEPPVPGAPGEATGCSTPRRTAKELVPEPADFQDVPLGMPVDPDTLRRLKDRARHPDEPPPPASADKTKKED